MSIFVLLKKRKQNLQFELIIQFDELICAFPSFLITYFFSFVQKRYCFKLRGKKKLEKLYSSFSLNLNIVMCSVWTTIYGNLNCSGIFLFIYLLTVKIQAPAVFYISTYLIFPHLLSLSDHLSFVVNKKCH